MRSREKILIADDDEAIHDALSHALGPHGFEIIHAFDGRQTLKLAKKEVPDLIILDIVMPIVDGRDVCMELKNDPATKHVKVLMMTAKGDPLDKMLGLDIGADDYIAKPFSTVRLSSKIEMALDKK
jgi:DNA-binding response OmpR family regulator